MVTTTGAEASSRGLSRMICYLCNGKQSALGKYRYGRDQNWKEKTQKYPTARYALALALPRGTRPSANHSTKHSPMTAPKLSRYQWSSSAYPHRKPMFFTDNACSDPEQKKTARFTHARC